MATKRKRKVAQTLHPINDANETWLNRTWRPLAALVYLAICLFDFIIAPAWSGMNTASVAQLALAAKDLDPTVGAVLVAAKEQWVPLTLQGSGLFHVAFGAILGVSAWTRGAAQIEMVKQQGESERSPYTPPFGPSPTPMMVGRMPQSYQPPSSPPVSGQMQPVTQVNINAGQSQPTVDNPDAAPVEDIEKF